MIKLKKQIVEIEIEVIDNGYVIEMKDAGYDKVKCFANNLEELFIYLKLVEAQKHERIVKIDNKFDNELDEW